MTDSIIVGAGSAWAGVIPKGGKLSIIDSKGGQGVDFLCYNADHPEERYHAPNTLKAARSLKVNDRTYVVFRRCTTDLFNR